ncbi:MAG: DUF4861 family protein [Planctomycetota bacterium]
MVLFCAAGFAAATAGPAVETVTPEPRAFARFVPERSDDFAWENDLVAFRAYGPALRGSRENAGIDCWLKRVPYPIVDKWYDLSLNHGTSYHEDHGEGLDNYVVGASLGCGGTALWIDEQIYPLETFIDWRIEEQTTERVRFVLTYENEVLGDVYREEKRIGLSLGERLFSAESRFWKNGEPAVGLPIAVGLTTHGGKAQPAMNPAAGWIALWEELDGSGLGAAVRVPPAALERVVLINAEENDKDAGHLLAITRTDAAGEVVYEAGYGWEKADVITDAGRWREYLDEE